MRTYKVKLKLNNKQRTRFFQNVGVFRFAYNLTIEIQEENHKQGNKFLSDCDVRKIITQRKQDDLAWLYSYDCDIVKQAVKDACNAYKTFFKNHKGKPKFKSKKFSKPSFYVDGWKLKIKDGYAKIPFCTKVRLYEKDYVPEGLHYQNPRITFDGINWWLSVGVKEDTAKPDLTNEIIGIDLGLKELATCSNGITFHNVSKFKNYKKLEKSIKQKQRQVSRKYEANKQGKKFVKTNNIKKLEALIKKKRIKQQDIKKDYFHKSTTALVRTKPKAIVLEDLNADRFYPSSQICSHCGNRRSIKLSERVYRCPVCGLEIDRDLNASINLKHYREFPEKLSLWRAIQTRVA